MSQAKVFANVFTRRRGAMGNCIDFTIEYLYVSQERSGKLPVCVTNLNNENAITRQLKEGLVDYLNALYPNENLRERDIVGLTV